MTDSELFAKASSANNQGDRVTALEFLFAYMQRDPDAMARDAQHAQSVRDVYAFIDRDIRNKLEKGERDAAQLAAAQQSTNNGIGSRTSGVTAAPPPLAPPSGSSDVDWGGLKGRYSMVHDGWRGTLVLSPQGSTYTSWDNKQFNVTVEGHGYHVILYIASLGGQNADGRGGQKFDGYLMTRTKDAIAGVTWWEGQPFGFFARKES